ncbi:DUF2750 domain-containing protein [Sinorhizobium arboris]|uniref:DUF2750 domain-containing protein n=1 Tax=Sinorhizobium arboris TaxID=76745 RepID=UPI000A03CC3D
MTGAAACSVQGNKAARGRDGDLRATVALSLLRLLAISLAVFRDRWLEGLEEDSIRVGINWSGGRATGFDVEPSDVRRRLTFGA